MVLWICCNSTTLIASLPIYSRVETLSFMLLIMKHSRAYLLGGSKTCTATNISLLLTFLTRTKSSSTAKALRLWVRGSPEGQCRVSCIIPACVSVFAEPNIDLTIPLCDGNFSVRQFQGTLEDLWNHASSKTGRIVNALDFPLPDAEGPDPRLASDLKAWKDTFQNPLWKREVEYPVPPKAARFLLTNAPLRYSSVALIYSPWRCLPRSRLHSKNGRLNTSNDSQAKLLPCSVGEVRVKAYPEQR